eukprot:3941693-Rhodomonas_salina.3
MVLGVRYAMSGTELSHVVLCGSRYRASIWYYVVHGTERAYGTTGWGTTVHPSGGTSPPISLRAPYAMPGTGTGSSRFFLVVLRALYAMFGGTDPSAMLLPGGRAGNVGRALDRLLKSAIPLRASYAMSVTAVACSAIALRADVKPGTDIEQARYPPTRALGTDVCYPPTRVLREGRY